MRVRVKVRSEEGRGEWSAEEEGAVEEGGHG